MARDAEGCWEGCWAVSGRLDRRQALRGAAAVAAASALGASKARAQNPARAEPSAQFRAAWKETFGEREVRTGRVKLDIQRLAENGNAVPVKISVESPMTDADHVRLVHILSEQNPIARVARFHLGPRAGRADISTVMRLATTQNVHVVAEMSDGSLWADEAESVVLIAACLDAG